MENYLSVSFDAAPHPDRVFSFQNFRITLITSGIVRIEEGFFCDAATQAVIRRDFGNFDFSTDFTDDIFTISTNNLTLTCRYKERLKDSELTISLKVAPYTLWHYGDKPLHNLGGTLSTLDARNGACPIPDGICSIDGYGLIDDSNSAIFKENGWFENRPEGITDIYFLGYGRDYTTCVQDYYRLTGEPPMMPKYVFGNWWSRYHKYSHQEYIDLMDNFRNHDVPLSVAVVDMDWHTTDDDGRDYNKDGWTGYSWNKELFPDYPAFLSELHNRDLAVTLNLHPADGVRYWEDMYEKMALAMGVNPKTKAPIPFDILNPDFVKAYFEVLHFPYEDNGVDFWWMDWQQGTDYNWIHKLNGDVKNPLENITPLWLLNHFHYLASKRKGQRGLIFSRFAGHGSQRYPIGFSGDTCITWDTLDFQPYFTATASNIGYGWWSHDIGGHYRGYRDDELTTRWVQFGVFSPIFRLHSSRHMFSSREPWAYNKRAELVMTDFMKLRHRLFPYLYTMSYRNTSELIPLIRPMYHLWPEEKEAYNCPNQYLFGSEFLVAPITKKTDPKSDLGGTDVWFPEGIWVDWFSGFVYKGGTKMKVYRSLEQMPVFMKAGAIIPTQPHIKNDNALGLNNLVELTVAAGGSNSFTLFEDDGLTNEYTKGKYCKTRFDLSWKPTSAAFRISPYEGDTSLVPEKRDYTICFKGFRKGCCFSLGGKDIDAIYDNQTNSYVVKLEGIDMSIGCEITIENPDGLLHNNNDAWNRMIDLLNRSQTTFEEKFAFVERIRQNDIKPVDDSDHLSWALKEYLDQSHRISKYLKNN